MTAFDTDVLSDIWSGRHDYVAKASLIPVKDQVLTIVTAEEVLRGRFEVIRKAETKQLKIELTHAYDLFHQTLLLIRSTTLLPYTPAAHALVLNWRVSKLRVGTNDLRIAAIVIAHGATLVTRNRRDFDQIPGLSLAVWP